MNIKNTSQLDPIEYQKELSKSYENVEYADKLDYMETITYKMDQLANLLETPLELKHFLPLDEEGNVLEEPNFRLTSLSNNKKIESYNKAMESVLFEGCYLEDFKGSCRLVYNGLHFAEINKGETLFFYNSIKDIIHVPIPVTEQLKKLL